MLKITIPSFEGFDEKKQEFVNLPKITLQLEHSLVSISKWESKWNKPFISKEIKSLDEITDYIKCMTLTQNVDPNVYAYIPEKVIKEITDYINLPMTATTFREDKNKKNNEIITNEIIYYWMISLNVPFECEKWHLNRLLTLIKVCSIKNSPGKKMSQKEIYANNKLLNEARRAKYHTKG